MTIISRIWADATVILLISISPNNRVQEQKVFSLPAAIAFGATISTVVVLRKLRDLQRDLFPSETLGKLQQHLENLEIIVSSDGRHLDGFLKQLDQTFLELVVLTLFLPFLRTFGRRIRICS